MRGSAVRNLRRAGNDEHDCMEISGHKTRAIFDRYDSIIDEDDQRRDAGAAAGIQAPADRTGAESHPHSARWMNYHKTSTKELFF
jgi:hypothetical protein